MPRNGFIYKLFVLIFIVLFTTGISCSSGQESETAITETETSEAVTETETSEAVTETETSEKNSEASLWLEILVFALVFISFVVVAILALFDVEKNEKPFPYSLKRKKPHQKNPEPRNDTKSVAADNVPEVKLPSSDIDGHISQQTQNINELRRDLAGLIRNTNDLSETFMTLKTSLDQKDEEISRYKNGYDAIIFKNFLLRFTRVDKVIKEYADANKIDMNGLKDIQIQMDDALAECDVEIFSPEIGSNFKTSIGVADNPDIKETSNQSEDSTIAEVLKPGYRRKLPNASSEDYQIITEAKVIIYVYKKNKK